MYVYHVFVPGAHKGQKRVLDPSELELQMIVSHHVGDENQFQVLCRHSNYSQPQKQPPILWDGVLCALNEAVC